MHQSNRLWWLHIAALWALTIAQPLLDLIASNPDFLVAHQLKRAGVLGLTAAVVLLCPLLIIAVVAVIRSIHSGAGAVAAALAVGLLAALAGMQVGKRISSHAEVVIPVAVAAGVLYTVAYVRWSFVRTVASMLSIGIVAVPLVFWFKPPVFRILSARAANPAEAGSHVMSPQDGGQPAGARDIPVVVLVFDEISLVSLLDADVRIDRVLFPNLAELARAGIWFRNATTVSDYTRWALPAIVTGRLPRPDATPSARDHPQSIFSLLARSHEVFAIESITDLCPDDVCDRSDVPLGTSVARLGRDLFVIAQHIVLTADLARHLPDLAATWADFQGPGGGVTERARRTERRRRRAAPSPDSRMERISLLTRRIQRRGNRPGFYYLHSMLSHTPHWLLPSGQIDSTRSASTALRLPLALPGRKPEPWPRDEWLVAHAYQRHLLQLGFVDHVVGRIVGELKAAQLYERSLIVVLADHGAAFQAGLPRRDFTPETAPDIMRVPLIMKLPAASATTIDGTRRLDGQNVNDRNVETIDVTPTIAGVLGLRVPWKTDGRSLVDTAASERPLKTIYYDMARRRQDFDRGGPDLRPALQTKLDMFGGGENPYRIPRPPRFAELTGQPANRLRVLDGGCAVTVDYLSDFSRIDRDGDSVPFEVAGELEHLTVSKRPAFLAVSVNGTIRSITRPWLTAPREWLATPPLDAWRDGDNSVEVFGIDEAPTGIVLHRCAVREGRSHGTRE